MKTYKTFLSEASVVAPSPGLHHYTPAFRSPLPMQTQGIRVTVNDPSHALHGQTGRVLRQQGHDHGVEFPHLNRTEWLNSGQLEKAQ